MQAVERQDAAALRVDPEELAGFSRFRHREDARGVGLQEQARRDLRKRLVAQGATPRPALRGTPPASGCCSALLDVGLVEQRVEERRRRVDAVDDQLVERAAQAGERELAVAAVHDQLADQAVVVGRDRVAVVDGAVHADAEAARRVVGADPAGRGLEVRQLLGVDPALDRVAGRHQLVLGEGHRQAGGDADLLLHEVDVVDRLGHRVLDLQAGVHLDEVELALLVEELDRAGAGVVDLRDGVGADLADPGAGRGVDHRRGRLLEHLLVAALQRAVALAEVHGAALAVAEDLDLDVARGAPRYFSR